jgi:hypothetical protein
MIGNHQIVEGAAGAGVFDEEFQGDPVLAENRHGSLGRDKAREPAS